MYQNLYSPWRAPYFSSVDDDACVFCEISKKAMQSFDSKVLDSRPSEVLDYGLPGGDSKGAGAASPSYVFYNDDICFGVMNLYPYTPGHFMLIPHSHVDSPSLLPSESWLHLSALAQKAVCMLEEYGANGINVGLNIKQAAGAGIPAHLHWHFVPRFEGDTNFITTIGAARVYGLAFDEVFNKISFLAKKHLV